MADKLQPISGLYTPQREASPFAPEKRQLLDDLN